MGGRGGGAPAGRQAPAATSAPSAVTVDDVAWMIGDMYQSMIRGTRGADPRDFVSLTEIRARLPQSALFDDALRKINNMKGNNIIPQSNQKILTDRDRASFVRIGNEDRLLISMSNFPERPK